MTRLLALLPLLVLCACTEMDDVAQCMFTPVPGAVGTCLLPEGADRELDPAGLEAVDLEAAVVVATGHGAPASSCVELDSWLGLAVRSQDPTAASWVELEDSSADHWTLALMAPEGDLGLAVGETADLLWHWTPGLAADVQLRDEDGQLVAWLGRALEPAELGLPAELQVAEGEQIQACAEDCGVVRYTELQAELDGETVELGWEEAQQLGDYLLSHPGTVATDDDACIAGDCPMGTALAMIRND